MSSSRTIKKTLARRFRNRLLSKRRLQLEWLEPRHLLTGVSLLESTFFGGAGDQRGTDVEVQGSDLFVSVNANETQSPSASSFLVKYAAPTGPGTTPVFSKSWTLGTLNGITAAGGNVYGAGFSHPGDGLTNDGTGGTEVKTLLTNFDANNVAGGGPGGSNWAAAIPPGTFNASPGTSFFSYNGVENFLDAKAVDDGANTFVYATGHAQPCSHTTFVVGKYDAAGNIVAGATAASANFNICSAPNTAKGNMFGVTESGGDIYVAGGNHDAGANYRPTILKYDNNLNLQWTHKDPAITGEFRGLVSDGSYVYAAGTTQGDYLLAKFDLSGNQVWQTISGGAATGEFLSDVTMVGGRLFATGYTNASGAGGDDVVVLEVDPSTGAVLSTDTHGGTQTDRGNRITTDGTDLYVIGESRSFAEGGNAIGQNDAVLLRYGIVAATNTAPEITSLTIDQPTIFENETVTLNGAFTDVDLGDEHTVTIDWGDGTPNQVETLAIGDRSFSFPHQYLDDGPSPGNNTAQDTATISVTVTESIVVASPTWDLLEPAASNIPGRTGARTAYDPGTNRMIVFAGNDNVGNCGTSCLFNDTWILDNANGEAATTPNWTQLAPSGPIPQARTSHDVAYDEANNRLIMFGGSNIIGSCGGVLNDVWVLSDANGVGSPAWQQLSPTGTPPSGRRSMGIHYDPATNSLIVYGGSGNCTAGFTDAWVLQNANGLGGTPNWIPLAPAGPTPPSAENATAYDEANNRLIVWANCCTVFNNPELWVLEHANGTGGTPQWSQVAYSGTAPLRRGPSVVYDSAENELVLFGGTGTTSRLNDTFLLANANGLGGTPNWTQLAPAADPSHGLPPSRDSHDAIIDPTSGNMTIFGGTEFNFGNGDDHDDSWVLGRSSGSVGGGSDTETVAVVVKNVDPDFEAGSNETLPAGSLAFSRVGIVFTDPGTLDVHTVTVDYDGDAIIDQTINVPLGDRVFDLSYTYAASGTYLVTVNVKDDDKGALTDTFEVEVLPNNQPPETPLDIDPAANEILEGALFGTAVGITAEAFDPDNDPLVYTLTDDAGGRFDIHPVTGVVTVENGLLLDGPDSHVITIVAADPFGETASADFTINVLNGPPSIVTISSSATLASKALPGVPVTVSGTFTDPALGVATETFTADVDWGDQMSSQATIVGGVFTADHSYATGGIFTVTVTITDDDTGTTSATTTTVVTGVGVVGDVLYVIGTPDDDHVTINRQGNGLFKVHADFLASGNFVTVPTAGVEKIIAYLCAGDDHLTIAGKIDLPAIIHAGAGDDHVFAGGGPSVLLGDDGNDMLIGGRGRDVMIGGLGRDRLVGGKDDDVLIGGSTNVDDNDDALMGLLAVWTSAANYDDRVSAIDMLFTVEDDQEEDILTGSSGRDLFYDGLGDTLTDVKKKKDPETVK